MVLGMVALSGCGTTVADKAARSAELTATGQATIENFTHKGLTVTRLFTRWIDGEFLQSNGTKGVYPLTPGEHEFTISATFSRMTIGDLMIDAGEWKVRFTAEAGTRYRIRGRRINTATAEVWIEDATHNRIAAGPHTLPLTENPQNVPIVVPLPVLK